MIGCQQDPIADPSLGDRVHLENEADPAATTAGPREVLRRGAEPMQGVILRGLETPGTTDESAVSCPICGLVIEGLSTRAPGKRTLQPCGHDAGFLRASAMYDREPDTETAEYRLRTDGCGEVSEILDEYRQEVAEATEAVREEIESMSDAELREHLERSGGDGQ